MSEEVVVVAHSNIALVKYWGKREGKSRHLNLPAVGSISMTLDALFTTTGVVFDPDLRRDEFVLGAAPATSSASKDRERVSAFLDLVRDLAGIETFARVRTNNNFPTGAGLASSASGFAALALAATEAAGLDLSQKELSILARQGSGSAARSIYGGFVELFRGDLADGTDCYATQLAPESHWPLALVVAVTSSEKKHVSSREGMERTTDTSPYYPAWITSHPNDLDDARRAIETKDFDSLSEVTESSCLKMHASMMAARPPLLYWNGATTTAMQEIQRLRRSGVPVCFTADAGPQVKAICAADAIEKVEKTLSAIHGVHRLFRCGLGSGAHRATDVAS